MMRRDCGEWQGMLALDAIGLASESESRDLQEHLVLCPSCRQDATELQGAAGALRSVDPAQADRLGSRPPSTTAASDIRVDTERVGSETTLAGPFSSPGPPSGPQPGPRAVRGRRRRLVGVGVTMVAAAAAIVAVVAQGGGPPAPSRTAALTGQAGVQASIALTSQAWGTRATLRESGQTPGQVLTVAMRSSSGRWWVAGSYRTSARSGPLVVQLSCAVALGQITEIWVTDQNGHAVLNGYAH